MKKNKWLYVVVVFVLITSAFFLGINIGSSTERALIHNDGVRRLAMLLFTIGDEAEKQGDIKTAKELRFIASEIEKRNLNSTEIGQIEEALADKGR